MTLHIIYKKKYWKAVTNANFNYFVTFNIVLK